MSGVEFVMKEFIEKEKEKEEGEGDLMSGVLIWFSLALLRYIWHITFSKGKVYNVMVCYVHILQYDYYSKAKGSKISAPNIPLWYKSYTELIIFKK